MNPKYLWLLVLMLITSVSATMLMVYGSAGLAYWEMVGWTGRDWINSLDAMMLTIFTLLISSMVLGTLVGKWFGSDENFNRN